MESITGGETVLMDHHHSNHSLSEELGALESSQVASSSNDLTALVADHIMDQHNPLEHSKDVTYSEETKMDPGIEMTEENDHNHISQLFAQERTMMESQYNDDMIQDNNPFYDQTEGHVDDYENGVGTGHVVNEQDAIEIPIPISDWMDPSSPAKKRTYRSVSLDEDELPFVKRPKMEERYGLPFHSYNANASSFPHDLSTSHLNDAKLDILIHDDSSVLSLALSDPGSNPDLLDLSGNGHLGSFLDSSTSPDRSDNENGDDDNESDSSSEERAATTRKKKKPSMPSNSSMVTRTKALSMSSDATHMRYNSRIHRRNIEIPPWRTVQTYDLEDELRLKYRSLLALPPTPIIQSADEKIDSSSTIELVETAKRKLEAQLDMIGIAADCFKCQEKNPRNHYVRGQIHTIKSARYAPPAITHCEHIAPESLDTTSNEEVEDEKSVPLRHFPNELQERYEAKRGHGIHRRKISLQELSMTADQYAESPLFQTYSLPVPGQLLPPEKWAQNMPKERKKRQRPIDPLTGLPMLPKPRIPKNLEQAPDIPPKPIVLKLKSSTGVTLLTATTSAPAPPKPVATTLPNHNATSASKPVATTPTRSVATTTKHIPLKPVAPPKTPSTRPETSKVKNPTLKSAVKTQSPAVKPAARPPLSSPPVNSSVQSSQHYYQNNLTPPTNNGTTKPTKVVLKLSKFPSAPSSTAGPLPPGKPQSLFSNGSINISGPLESFGDGKPPIVKEEESAVTNEFSVDSERNECR